MHPLRFVHAFSSDVPFAHLRSAPRMRHCDPSAADLPPHDPEQYTQCPRHGVRESRTRLARHSVIARQDFRGTRLHLRFYCNRKPPLSASGQHRFMKHPAPIFKMKAPAPPPHPAVHLEKTRIFRQIGSEKLYSWGRGKFVKKLYKKEPSPIVKFLVSGCKKLIRTSPSPPSSSNTPPRSCPSQMPPFRPLLEKTHIFRHLGTGFICPIFGQNKPVPKCLKSFRVCINRSSLPTAEKYVQILHIATHFDVQNLHIRIDFSCVKLNI